MVGSWTILPFSLLIPSGVTYVVNSLLPVPVKYFLTSKMFSTGGGTMTGKINGGLDSSSSD